MAIKTTTPQGILAVNFDWQCTDGSEDSGENESQEYFLWWEYCGVWKKSNTAIVL